MQGNASSPLGDNSMRVQYVDTLISCNKYRQINYQLPNEVISGSMTLPRALALCAVSPKTKLYGREIDRSKPLLASSHAMIWSSRLPKPSSGTATLTLTGKRRSASRTACLSPKATDWRVAPSCAALMKRPGDNRWGVDDAAGLPAPAGRDRRSRHFHRRSTAANLPFGDEVEPGPVQVVGF